MTIQRRCNIRSNFGETLNNFEIEHRDVSRDVIRVEKFRSR